MCVDYMDINAQTEKNIFLKTYQRGLAEARFFAFLKFFNGYHQVELASED